MNSFTRKIVEAIAARCGNPRKMYGTSEGPYLSRFYLKGKPKTEDGIDAFDADGNLRAGVAWPKRRWAAFLHHFHRSDEDTELHSHPWKWAVCIILVGGYREQSVLPDFDLEEETGPTDILRWNIATRWRTFFPFSVNVLTEKTFHRVELLEEDAWSLVIVGPKAKSWGFLDVESRKYQPWRDFIRSKGLEPQ